MHDVALGCLDCLHAVERREGRESEACRPLEVEVPGLVHDEAVEGHGHELGVGAAPQVRLGGDDTVTSSPTANPVTPSPSASISPAWSLPITTGYRCSIMPRAMPFATNTSNPFTEEAHTFTRTSPGPGSGVGTSITAA